MKKAFSMILAIIFIVAVASIGALSIALSNTGAKTSVNLFFKEQAKLLAQGASEYAILKIQQNDFATTCIDEIEVLYPSDDNPTFVATIKLTYIGKTTATADPAVPDTGFLRHCTNKISSTSNLPLEAVIINTKVESQIEGQEKITYSLTTTQVP